MSTKIETRGKRRERNNSPKSTGIRTIASTLLFPLFFPIKIEHFSTYNSIRRSNNSQRNSHWWFDRSLGSLVRPWKLQSATRVIPRSRRSATSRARPQCLLLPIISIEVQCRPRMRASGQLRKQSRWQARIQTEEEGRRARPFTRKPRAPRTRYSPQLQRALWLRDSRFGLRVLHLDRAL